MMPYMTGTNSTPELVDLMCLQDKDLEFCDAVAAIIIVRGSEKYLMQRRDPKPGIFYPGHWGVFGGAQEPGEDELTTLERELFEEICLQRQQYDPVRFFSIHFGPEAPKSGFFKRIFYTLEIDPETISSLELNEGAEMRALSWKEALDPTRPVCPYDAFAIWVHHNQSHIS